ncbi:uncharacterized protein CPUR_05647 [Claviceps purpurea 20.1]|uniref:F-box domain-containing protein n=1 Tax=Claviceps purpurea (strain 20.1) TaxID=1111077 RepID=M1VWS7_CLAP2|nr:uncharacterized protein CPUR_05647 [Claviceps purpurea 20.1]
MDSAPREARLTVRERVNDDSMCPLVLLPQETKIQIVSHISTQQSLSRLGQTCRAWHEVANEELYKRDSREQCSFAIKWMAAHAVDEQTTASALRTLEISRQWGGQIDAVKRHLSRWGEGNWGLHLPRWDAALSDSDVKMMYDESPALHFAIILGNMRLTETLLDMGASLEAHCSPLLWESLGSKEFMPRFDYFHSIYGDFDFSLGPMFPIFLAFLQLDSDMCQLLVDHGVGREAVTVEWDGISSRTTSMSILHFAAVDCTTDYRQWQCLFDGFREYIHEPCPRDSKCTPLHVALVNGCTQGMQILVESGADKVAKNDDQQTPLAMAIQLFDSNQNSERIEEYVMCFRKFVDLGGSVNPEGDLLAFAMQLFARQPNDQPNLEELIYFLLKPHADMDGTILEPCTNVVTELVYSVLDNMDDEDSQEALQEIWSKLVDRGLNLKQPARGLPSPLFCALHSHNAEPKWFFDFLCENGATIHEEEADKAFLRWVATSRLWRTNEYNAWWLYQGEEDEIFLKWCEHPYNYWWWQHVKQISSHSVTLAYRLAFRKSRPLYDILKHVRIEGRRDD